MPRLLAVSTAALISCGLVAGPASAAAPKPLKMSDLVREYDLRISVSMKSKFAFQPDPVGCNGRLPSGYAGSGEEIVQMTSPKPVRVTMVDAPGADVVVNRKDMKAGFELAGESRRSGDMTFVTCNQSKPGQAAPCVGTFPLSQKVEMGFFDGRWRIKSQSGPTTRQAVPSCDEDSTVFDWDGAVARTGITLLEPATGAAARSRLKARSFTLEARLTESCDVPFFGTGTCGTEWVYRANFRKAKSKRRG
jgi:hypothetical protein